MENLKAPQVHILSMTLTGILERSTDVFLHNKSALVIESFSILKRFINVFCKTLPTKVDISYNLASIIKQS